MRNEYIPIDCKEEIREAFVIYSLSERFNSFPNIGGIGNQDATLIDYLITINAQVKMEEKISMQKARSKSLSK